ncbi:hypothetical protein EVAR_21658_1 [Eumeta japonica]|uniref:Uncharacterized protein n=1 Tax=Eumeta variegata TaxID=151549 RepID=A0A4C1VJD5_EUMVA|nr:hypothetical protein EVAR_21658_1 [Eumeta japonica]
MSEAEETCIFIPDKHMPRITALNCETRTEKLQSVACPPRGRIEFVDDYDVIRWRRFGAGRQPRPINLLTTNKTGYVLHAQGRHAHGKAAGQGGQHYDPTSLSRERSLQADLATAARTDSCLTDTEAGGTASVLYSLTYHGNTNDVICLVSNIGPSNLFQLRSLEENELQQIVTKEQIDSGIFTERIGDIGRGAARSIPSTSVELEAALRKKKTSASALTFETESEQRSASHDRAKRRSIQSMRLAPPAMCSGKLHIPSTAIIAVLRKLRDRSISKLQWTEAADSCRQMLKYLPFRLENCRFADRGAGAERILLNFNH